MGLTQARIEILDKEAIGQNGLERFLDVQFNPQEYTINKGAQIAEIAVYGIDSPILQFIRGQNETLGLELFFDTTEDGMGEGARDVTELTKPFYQLVKIQPKTHAPPRIRFTWGQGLSFKAIVESVQQKFDLFNPNGVPLRATLTLSLREYKTLEEQLSELKPESSDHTKTYTVQRGDTLSRIAAREYGDPALWRPIADANPDLPNVRQLKPGARLVIPPLDVFTIPKGSAR
jgi:nucleoid-associated protein YgaU